MDAGVMINWELRGISPSSQNLRSLEIVLAKLGGHPELGIKGGLRIQ